MREIKVICKECGEVWSPVKSGNFICPNCGSARFGLAINDMSPVIKDEIDNNTLYKQPDYELNSRRLSPHMPSDIQRAEIYFMNFFQLLFFSIVATFVFCFKLPLVELSLGRYVSIFLISRGADLVTTMIALQMPWLMESNPLSDARSLNGDFWPAQFLGVGMWILISHLLYLFVPGLGIFTLLVFSLIGFTAAFTNLFQAFFMMPTNPVINGFAVTIVSIIIFHILKVLMFT